MNKTEFRQWFIEHLNVGDNFTVGPSLLDAILDHAAKLSQTESQTFLKEMFANVDISEEEITRAGFHNGVTDREGVCPVRGSDRTYIVTELCPHCENEIEMHWNTDTDGYKAFCPVCGKRLMLCDECRHTDGISGCDYDSKTDSCRFNKM